MFNRIFRISLMVAIGAIVVAGLGAATTAGIAAARGELGMGQARSGIGMASMRMAGENHGRGDHRNFKNDANIAPAGMDGEMGAGAGAEMQHGAMPGSGAEAGMQPMPPQWLMLARGLLRGVASLVPLALFVAGISWVLHRTSEPMPAPVV